jgi:hypothetical protein
MSETNGHDQLSRDAGPGREERVSPRAMIAIEPSEHEIVKAKMRPKLGTWCDNILKGVDKNERNAMNLYGRLMGLVGAEYELNINVLASKELGMSIDQAKRKLGMVTMVEGIDLDGAVSMMELHVREYYRARGKRVVILDEEAAA